MVGSSRDICAIAERPPAEVIHENRFLAVTERIRSTDAPTVYAAAIRAHSQAHEMFESRMIQYCEGLRILIAQQRKLREVTAEDEGAQENVEDESDYTYDEPGQRPPDAVERRIQAECAYKRE